MDSATPAKPRFLPALRSRPPGSPGSLPDPAHGPLPGPAHGPASREDLLAATGRPLPYATQPVRPWVQLATRAAVWAAIGFGCLGAIVGLLRPAGSAEPVAPPPAESDEMVPATVANFAELAVDAWLRATQQDHGQADALFAADLDFQGAGVEGRQVVRVATVGGSRLQEGYWKVTVAADVVDPGSGDGDGGDGGDRDGGGGGGSESGGSARRQTVDGDQPAVPGVARWFVEIGIAGDAQGGLTAVGAPALMPARAADLAGLRIVGPDLEPATDDDPIVVTLRGFFDAFLTGTGDLSRYLAEGVRGTPITPAPFTTATVERVAVEAVSDTELLVRAEVRVTTAGGVEQLLGYELQAVLSSSRRWEIRHAAGAPTLVRDEAEGEGSEDAEGDQSGDGGQGGDGDGDGGTGDGTGGHGTTTTRPNETATTKVTVADEPGM